MGISDRRLRVPENLEDDPKSNEFLSVWKKENGPQTFLIDQNTYDDPAIWGLLLVDIAHHVSKAYERNKQFSRKEAFKRIMEGFNAELESPTDDF